MRQNAGLLTQHVSGASMPIIRSTLVSSAFWCPNLEKKLSIEVWSTGEVCYSVVV
jgi:hypothetical protein